jgi:trans-2,3-dihydro-3-hydroxyanthranilate isomerase
MAHPVAAAVTQLDYFLVDVFTESALAGNPLAVVMNTATLSTERMQAIACEFNLSETTFVERRPPAQERSEGVRVRIFTTQEELPFAGHPTLGTSSVLKLIAPEALQEDTLTLALNVGRIPVRFESNAGPALFAEMTQRDPEFGPELDPARVAAVTGLSSNDLDPAIAPQVVSTGTAFAIAIVRSIESLSRLRVNHEEADPWLRSLGARWFYFLAPVKDPDSLSPRYRARMQFYGGEDPATGSAAGCAISYLVSSNMVPSGSHVHVRQGVEMGRPSDLCLSAKRDGAKVSDVRVAGSTVLVAKGTLFLP